MPPLYYDSNPPVYFDSGALWDSNVAAPVESKRMAKVSLRLDRRDLDGKLNLGDTLVAGITDNAADFTNPVPLPADITARLTSIRTKRTQRQGLLDQAEGIAELVLEEEKDLERLLTRLAKYAESKVDGDASKLATAGFPLQGASQNGELLAPANFTVTIGSHEGECDGKCNRVSRAKSYVAEAATAATGPWTQVYAGTRARFTAKNLVSGQLYYFRMKAIGASGDSQWSDIAQKRAA
jgi:hypothetical protein